MAKELKSKDLKYYVGKEIIARLTTFPGKEEDENETKCLIYPIWEKNGNNWELIDRSDFGYYKTILVYLTGGVKACNFIRDMGEIVNIRINRTNPNNQEHLQLQEDIKGNLACNMRYSKERGERGSQIWIEEFKERSNFYQIVPCKMQFEDLKNSHHFVPDEEIYTNEILIQCEGSSFIYGPFKYDWDDDEITVSAPEANDYYIKHYDVDIIDETYDITDERNNIRYSLVLRDYLNSEEHQGMSDWLTDDELFEYFADELRKCQYPDEQIELVRTLGSSKSLDMRKVRIRQQLNKITNNKKCVKELFQAVINDDDMRKTFLDNIPNDHDLFKTNNIYMEDMSRKNEDLKIKNEELASENDRLTEENADLTKEVNNLTKQNTELSAKQNEAEKIILPDPDMEAKIEKLNEEKQDLERKLKLQGEYDEILKEKEDLAAECKEYESKLEQIKGAIGKSVEDLSSEVNMIQQHINSELMQRVLNNINEKDTESTKIFDEKLLKELSADEIIDRVKNYLDKSGREVSKNEVINYLTCISQGFITTFAGEPGTGKTSLCGLIGRALGLVREDDSNRMAEVSVERGWTSVKDFIGYYNPLTRRMEKSNIEMFNALNTLDQERPLDNVAPYFVLLDEANLSPIEHYWANFLKFCDEDSGISRTLNLGGQYDYFVPKQLRFLSTVNFDHTTEALSPRFLDRSWIITLNAKENIKPTAALPVDTTVVSYASLIKAFSDDKEDVEQENDNYLKSKNKWKQIKDIFKDHHLSIMPRNQKMVENYIKIASRYMQTSQMTNNKYPAIDYAVAQKILPLINGFGDDYQNLIEEMLRECDDMPLTYEHLQRIERNAKNNMGYYQFFAR